MADQVDPRMEKLKDLERRLRELRAWADARFAELRLRQKNLLEQAVKERDAKLLASAKQALEATPDEARKAS